MVQKSLLQVGGVAILRPPETIERVRVERHAVESGWMIIYETKAGEFYLAKHTEPTKPLVFKSLDTAIARIGSFDVSPSSVTVIIRG